MQGSEAGAALVEVHVRILAHRARDYRRNCDLAVEVNIWDVLATTARGDLTASTGTRAAG
jgi:hypothetical protein